MIIQGINYNVLNVYNSSITLPDSFTIQNNKYGKGHGEAKLYIGTKHQMQQFFGSNNNCFVLKDDFVNYRNSLQSAKAVLSSIYKNSIGKNKNFNRILSGIDATINKIHSQENFSIKLKNNLQGTRGYINSSSRSKSDGYYLMRACSIPFISFIRILKLQEVSSGNIFFYFKLFPNFDEMYRQVQYVRGYGKRNNQNTTGVRPGQAKYKRDLLSVFGGCPFSHIQDERLLVASHIQPFALCNNAQKYDVDNGLLLSPLYDKLFDRGFITFDQQGNIRKTVWLDPNEWNKFSLIYQVPDLHLTPARKAYLKFHEDHVFLG